MALIDEFKLIPDEPTNRLIDQFQPIDEPTPSRFKQQFSLIEDSPIAQAFGHPVLPSSIPSLPLRTSLKTLTQPQEPLEFVKTG